jgi:hypothetical protein
MAFSLFKKEKIQIKDICYILKMEWGPTLAKSYTVYVPWKPSIKIYTGHLSMMKTRLIRVFLFHLHPFVFTAIDIIRLHRPKENPARTYMKMASNNLRVDYETLLL